MAEGGRTRMQSLAASPTMVGAITTLIVIVAVFLAYNANQGLPFVPTYRVSAEVPNAARLVRSNEIRIGGHRAGVVESVESIRDERTGKAAARLNMKLDQSAKPLPKGTMVRVRYRSSFGLKYVELVRPVAGEPLPDGHMPSEEELEDLPEGGTIPVTQTVEQVEFDDIANTFDTETRTNSRTNLIGFGSGFAGRGQSLNQAIENLNPLFRYLEPVMRRLSDPGTGLERFFKELGDAARVVAPIAAEQSELFTNLAITFAAISADPEALKQTIEETPATLAVGISSLRAQRPFLTNFAELSRILRPGVRELRRALPTLNDAFELGAPVLLRSVSANAQLKRVLREVEQLVDQPQTKVSLIRLRELFDEALPAAQFIGPAQTVCNYWNYWFTFLPEHLTDQDQVGYSQRVTLVGAPGATTPGDLPMSSLVDYGGIQANGRRSMIYSLLPGPLQTALRPGRFEPVEAATPTPTLPPPAGAKHPQPILHGAGVYNDVLNNGQADCQTGQTGYPLGTGPDAVMPGQAANNPTYGVTEIPGNQGRTTLYFDSSQQAKFAAQNDFNPLNQPPPVPRTP